jgi:hypothetical protein
MQYQFSLFHFHQAFSFVMNWDIFTGLFLNAMLLNNSQRPLKRARARVIKPGAINGARIIARVARQTFGSPMTAPYSAGIRAHI